jgi:hypothetical protein
MAMGINANGDVAGDSTGRAGGEPTTAWRWRARKMSRLPGASNVPSAAYDINNRGWMYGQIFSTPGYTVWVDDAIVNVRGAA